MNRPERTLLAAVALGIVCGVAACGDSSSPTAPGPPPPPPVRLLVFTDPVSGQKTSDVRDAHGEIMQFDSDGRLIWMATRTPFRRFPEAWGFKTESLSVLWGTENGERRAYLTAAIDWWHYEPPSILIDIEVDPDGHLAIRFPTPSVPLPATPPPEVKIAVFTDPATRVQTSDVRDVHGQIVQFTTAGALVWAADKTPFAGFPVAFGYDREAIVVAWGTEKGERRAYLTFSPDYWHFPPPASLADLEVVEGKLVIRHPDPPVWLPGG